MDEQAGPGVFFSNNHPGAGGAKGLGPLAEAAAAGDGAAAAGAARAQYSLPGILHFLQHEWARFEVERAQWEVERAELQVKTLPAGPSSSRLFGPFRPAQDPFPSPPFTPRSSPPLCSAHPIQNRVPLPPSPLPFADPTSLTRVPTPALEALFTLPAPFRLLLPTLNSVSFQLFSRPTF